jgi:N-acyl amino acid synthase of PEP-CTERM/exosortase system
MADARTPLVEAFQRYFEIVPATSPALIDAVYRIRYEVYCRELHFESEDAFPDGRETDLNDGYSKHCLLRHRSSKTFAGCVRLVMNNPQDPHSLLPFERHCSHSLQRNIIDPGELNRASFGEISRLAVVSRFRRRPGDQGFAHGVPDDLPEPSHDERRVFPHIALGLYLAAAAMGLRAGLDTVFVMMEPRLARHMRRYGIVFTQAGDAVDYHGQRGPFFITREDLYANMEPEIRSLLDLVYGDLGGQRAGPGNQKGSG